MRSKRPQARSKDAETNKLKNARAPFFISPQESLHLLSSKIGLQFIGLGYLASGAASPNLAINFCTIAGLYETAPKAVPNVLFSQSMESESRVGR